MAWAASVQSAATERPSPTAIARDMGRTRADLAATLAALRQLLAPPRLVEKGSEMVDATLRQAKDGLGAAVRRHPRWIGLVGLAVAGLGWFLVARGRGARALTAPRRDLGSLLRPVREPPGWLVGPVSGATEAGSAAIESEAEPVGAATERVPSGNTRLGRAGESASDVIGHHPLVVGTLALAAAAAVAMLLPPSRNLHRALGPADLARAEGVRRRAKSDPERSDKTAAEAASHGRRRGAVS